MNFLVRIFLTALLFAFVFPQVAPGVHFHGPFWPDAIIGGLVLALVAWIVDALFIAFGILTLGIGILLRWMLFFIVPALQLELFAYLCPQKLTVSNFGVAIWAGLFVMVVNILTTERDS